MIAPGDTDAMGEMGTSAYTWKYLEPTNMFLALDRMSYLLTYVNAK